MEPIASLPAAEKHASGLAFSPDGKTLVTGGMSGALKTWHTKDWTLDKEIAGHPASVNAITWTDRGPVTAGSDKTARLWKLPAWQEVAQLGAYTDCAAMGPIVYLRKDRGERIYRYDLDAAKVTAAVATGVKKLCGVWTGAGHCIIGGVGTPMYVLHPEDLSVVATLEGHETASTSCSITSDGKRLLSGDYDGNVHLWDTKAWKNLGHYKLGSKGYFFAKISPNGTHIATGGAGVVALHTIDGTTVAEHKVGIKGVYGVCWAPDGSHFVNAAADGNVRVYRAP